MTIRCATEDDVPHLARMMAATDPWRHSRYSPSECEEELAASCDDLYVAESEGALLGFVLVNKHSSLGGVDIHYLCVDAPYRGRKVGTRLVNFVCDELFPSESVNLTVSDFNWRARKLYRRLGFQHIGTIPDYNFAGEDEYVMRRHRRPKRQDLAPSGAGND
jgi:ribosomal protein S18 acetylase RimI-like enzyme